MDIYSDKDSLKLLSIFHYVVGGMIIFLSLFTLIHFFMGLGMILSPESFSSGNDIDEIPLGMGYFFAAIGAAMFIFGESLGIAAIISGRSLSKHKRYWFSLITACFLCLFTPLGTVLGIFTIIILLRPSVKELYGLG